MDQKNSSSLASDNTKTQDTGQQNNQGTYQYANYFF